MTNINPYKSKDKVMICIACKNNINTSPEKANVVGSGKVGDSIFLYINPYLRKLVTLSFMGKAEKLRHVRRFFLIYNQCLAERETYYLECPNCKSHNQYLGRSNHSVNYSIL